MGGANLCQEFVRYKDAKDHLVNLLEHGVIMEGEGEGWGISIPLFFRCASIEYDYTKEKYVIMARFEK